MTNVARPDGTNEPGEHGVAPEAPPNPRGQKSRHYDNIEDRGVVNAHDDKQALRLLKQALDETDGDASVS